MTNIDFSEAEVHEKIDGSLIKVYNYDSTWHISTRGTAFAESECNGFGVTFKELVMRSMPDFWIGSQDEAFQRECNFWLDADWTYIFEFTSTENRVVTRYEGYNLTYLAARHNQTGEYGDEYEEHAAVDAFECAVAKRYKFDTIEHCLEVVKELPDMQEGYVVYVGGKPVCKIKSPAYVAAHHIRSEGLNPKRIMQLVLMNEVDEYLAYFEEDRKFFTPYVDALANGVALMEEVYDRFEGIEDQKEFALNVSKFNFSAVLFKARSSGKSVVEVFHAQTEQSKMRLLSSWATAIMKTSDLI